MEGAQVRGCLPAALPAAEDEGPVPRLRSKQAGIRGFSPSTQEPAGGKPKLSVSQTRASSAALPGLGVRM